MMELGQKPPFAAHASRQEHQLRPNTWKARAT
jgi:hypothetical protein